MPLSYYLKYLLLVLTTRPQRLHYELEKLRRDYQR